MKEKFNTSRWWLTQKQVKFGEELYRQQKEIMDAKSGLMGNTVLIQAVCEKNISGMHGALGWGADINKMNNMGYTALMYAAKTDFREGVEILLTHKANVNASSPDGTALILAVQAPIVSANIVERLVEFGANVLMKDCHGKTALDYARERLKETPESMHEYPHARERVVEALTAAARKQSRKPAEKPKRSFSRGA